MALERGWKPQLTISPDGAASFYEFDEMTEINFSSEPETEEIRTINNNGNKDTQIISSSRSIEVSGYFSTLNYSQEILMKSHSLNGEFHIRFYPDKSNLTAFWQARAICSSFTNDNAAEGFKQYSATIEIQSLPVFVGNVA